MTDKIEDIRTAFARALLNCSVRIDHKKIVDMAVDYLPDYFREETQDQSLITDIKAMVDAMPLMSIATVVKLQKQDRADLIENDKRQQDQIDILKARMDKASRSVKDILDELDSLNKLRQQDMADLLDANTGQQGQIDTLKSRMDKSSGFVKAIRDELDSRNKSEKLSNQNV